MKRGAFAPPSFYLYGRALLPEPPDPDKPDQPRSEQPDCSGDRHGIFVGKERLKINCYGRQRGLSRMGMQGINRVSKAKGSYIHLDATPFIYWWS